MKQFKNLIFSYLPNEAHFRFFDRATRAVSLAGTSVQSALAFLIPELNSWFVKETACIEWYRKSELTAAIAEADRHLDDALVGFAAQVNGARYSMAPPVAAAGERLYIMLKSYGEVIRKPYLQEAGSVKAILLHLNGDLSADVLAAGLRIWPPEIQTSLDTFVHLMEEREAHTLLKPEEGFPAVRRGIEDVWHRSVTLVNAGAALGQSPDFGALIDSLNPEIDYLNGEFHRVRYNIASAEPAPIGQQVYTGLPCTPVPEVLYVTPKETLRLTLGKDFNIAYKNNVNVGNAECTIYGKGRYKGHKTVTFIIAR
ncbi:MAG: DUF6261 family protein [Prevotellaceae bacterium]|jgi:hypothetical protein|nr:DUF6261 family protein [Prevotellaceae bacterium]